MICEINSNRGKSKNKINDNLKNQILSPKIVESSCKDFQSIQSSSLAEEMKRNHLQNEETITNKDTGDNSSCDQIDEFIDFIDEFDDEYFDYEIENNKEKIQNEKNPKTVNLVKIKKNFLEEEKNNKDITKSKEDSQVIIEQFINYFKTLDQSMAQMVYKKLKKLKEFFFQLKNNGYDLSKLLSIKKDCIISNSNITKFLNNHSLDLAIKMINKIIDKLNEGKEKRIPYIKKVNTLIYQTINIRYNKILFNSNIENILSNKLNDRYKKDKVGYNKKRYDNKFILEELKKQNKSLIEKILKYNFSHFYYIYVFEDKVMDDIILLDDDLKEDGKFFQNKKNKKLTKEEIKRKILKIKYFAYKNYLSIIEPRNIITEELIEQFQDTNLNKDVKNEFLSIKRKLK